MKVQKIISLDKETAELAARKSNFSGWVRDQLRRERNKGEEEYRDQIKANNMSKIRQLTDMSSGELLYHLEQRSPEEIRALVAILRNI